MCTYVCGYIYAQIYTDKKYIYTHIYMCIHTHSVCVWIYIHTYTPDYSNNIIQCLLTAYCMSNTA